MRETLRHHPPAPLTLWRFTTEEVEIAGVHLPPRAPVLVDILGIGTDPQRPAGPDLTGLQPVLTGGAVELYQVPGPVQAAADPAGRRWTVLLADLLVGGLILAAAAVAIAGMARYARPRLLHSPVTSSSEGS